VIRDHFGIEIRVVVSPISYGDSTRDEAMGLLMGLRKFKKFGESKNALVEGV